MARLIKTEKEVEGRYSEQWIVVDEDALDRWPAGPLDVVGQPHPKQEGHVRARGEALFIGDLAFPGMLHAAMLRSPHARARVSRLDLTRARAADGVRGAVGPDECHVLTLEPNFEGQPVAAVCADTEAQARRALELIDVEWEPLEPLLDPAEAVRRGSFYTPPRTYERGDVELALAQADVVVEAEYRTQVVNHNALETHQSVVRWEGDVLEVYVSTQYIWGVRRTVASQLGLPEDRVRVVCNYMGGGFGAKNSPGDQTFVAAALATQTRRAVRCSLSRREENVVTGNRNATVQRLTVGARSDGTITALRGEFVNAIGWSGFSGPTFGPMELLYACENVRTETYGARLNLPPNAAFRAPGFAEGTFALESLLDELAARLDVDPLELRRLNHAAADLADGVPFSSKELLECYRRAEPWWERRDEVRARSEGSIRRGIGLASQIWYGGGGPPSYAWIRVGSDGHATVVTAMQDIGTGTRTVMAQIAAEELGVPLDWVQVSLGDSARGPFASISAGSSTTPSMGPAVRAAAADAKRQLLEIAAQRFEVDEELLDIRDARFVAADGESWPLDSVTGLLEDAQILGKGARGPNPAGMRVLTFGVQVAEVAVDIETGEVRVERVLAVHDVGRVINPLGARSQVEGGVIQGIGHTFSEERLADPATGRVLTQTLDSYRMPTIADIPEIVVDLVDVPDEHLTNLGSKGLGEPPIVPTAAAIANAIRDATGADVRALPIGRAEMLRALREADARERERKRERVGTRQT